MTMTCKYCGSQDFAYMEMDMGDDDVWIYWYHYGDYDKGCRQRINVNELKDYVKEDLYVIGLK